MNNTKKTLIIAAIVLNFLTIGVELFFAISGLLKPYYQRAALFYYIFDFIQIAAYLVCNGLLIYSIAGKGQMFRQRYGFYMSAVIISLILNLLSVATILLIISLFTSDLVWVKPEKENVVTVTPESKEKKIEKLRKLKEEGKISEEEYNDELMKLL